jgi:hypothetical protein
MDLQGLKHFDLSLMNTIYLYNGQPHYDKFFLNLEVPTPHDNNVSLHLQNHSATNIPI